MILLWFVMYKLEIVKNPLKIMHLAIGLVAGKKVEDFSSLVKQFTEEILVARIYVDAKKEIAFHKQQGRQIVLITNAIEPIISELAKQLNVENYFATKLRIVNGSYTGEIDETVYAQRKKEKASMFLKERNINAADTWAYSDHISDEHLLKFVSHPVVVNPDRILNRVAHDSGWPIYIWSRIQNRI